MDFINKYSRFMRNTGPARVLVPIGIILIVFGIVLSALNSGDMVETTGKITAVEQGDSDKEFDVTVSYSAGGKQYSGVLYNLSGDFSVGDDIKLFYDSNDPAVISNTGNTLLFGLAAMAVGLLSLIAGIMRTVKAVKKSTELDREVPAAPAADFTDFKTADGVKEYYCSHDGNTLKPGYVVDDADRKVIYEAKMLKLNPIGPRTFEFTNHLTGAVAEHEVGHTLTETYNNEYFSARSTFRFDGKDVWDVLHEKGLRLSTNMLSQFPKMIYEVTKEGKPFAVIETSSKYVHEEDAAEHSINIPAGSYYYRIWTGSDDLDTLFLTVFAISETDQALVE